MRDYQPQKNNNYILPNALYRQIIWLVRDYERLKEAYLTVELHSKSYEDIPFFNASSKPVEHEVIRKLDIRNKIDAIESALSLIPTEYQKGIWNNIVKEKAYPLDASTSTYGRWKRRFIYYVAYNMNWI